MIFARPSAARRLPAVALALALLLPAACSSGDIRRATDEFKGFVFNEDEAQANKTRKLMVIGDSWAQFLTSNHTFDHLLHDYGYPDYYAGSTALIGSKAYQWAKPANLAAVTKLLIDRKDTSIVVLTIGGNDLIESWNTRLSPEQADREFEKIAAHVETIVRTLTLARPKLRIVILGYDYPNLVESLESGLSDANQGYYKRLGKPTPAQVNGAATALGRKILAVAARVDRVEYVNNFGLMQYVYGDPQRGLAPNSVPFPGNHREEYRPFAGGRIDLPSPPEAMFQLPKFTDSIHLSGESYYYAGQNAMERYIDGWLKNE
ncbi:MAG: hypothetical protein NXI24_23275 [bacterium]|nr:hypothetical protein [bacterium]